MPPVFQPLFFTLVSSCYFFGLLFSQTVDYPKIISAYENVIVSEKGKFQLRCTNLTVSKPYEIYWLKDGKFYNSTVSTDDSSTSSKSLEFLSKSREYLVVNSAKLEDSGYYRCLVKNNFGAVLGAKTKVTVAYIRPFSLNNTTLNIRTIAGGFAVFAPPFLDTVPNEAIRWQWTFQGQAIFSNLTHFVTSNGRLVILNVQSVHVGNYNVEAYHTSLNLRVKSVDYSLDLDDNLPSNTNNNPEIVVPPQDFVFRDGSFLLATNHFVLECVAYHSNLVNVQIIWNHNDTVIVPDGIKYTFEEFTRRLLVHNPSTSRDGGVYSCQSRLINSPLSSSPEKQAWINVNSLPQIEQKWSPETNVGVGQRYELSCPSTGQPSPDISWYFNGINLKNQREICCSDDKPLQILSNGSLTFSTVTDATVGVYQCESDNVVGSDLISTYLKTESTKPTFVSQPVNVSAVAGQSISLPCSAQGSPPPQIKWKYNESDILFDSDVYQLKNDGSLVIPSCSVDNVGWYTCIASNNISEIQSRAFLHVAGKTQITSGPVDQSVIIGSNVAFPCEVSLEANQGSYVRQWYFRNQLLTPGASRNIELLPDGRLLIRQAGPSNIGSYTCTITSPSGTQNQTGSLSIIERPAMPLYVKAQLINGTLPARIKITWAEGFDGNSPIIKYQLQHRTLGAQDLWSDWETSVENIGKDQRTVIIDNLKPSANYEFRVLAINRFGPGLPSQPSNNVTMPQQPPAAAPRSVAGSARSSSSIMVQWQPPPSDQWNGDILGYIVRYRLANYPDINWIFVNVSDVRSRNVLLEDLFVWREYEIQAAAFNERGMGVFCKSVYITTLEGIPVESPLNVNISVVNSTAIFVSLVPPSQQMIPGVNLGYKVEAWRGPVNTGQLAKLVKILPYSLNKIEVTVNGLGKFLSYNITTLCYTAQGDGPRSHAIEIRTKQDIPDPVKNLRIEEVLFDSVKLVWDKPENPNGVLLNYSLTFWSPNDTESRRQTTLPPNSTWYRVQGLSPSTPYVFELFASTDIGAGPVRSVHIVSGVPPELPGPPTSLTISNIQPRSVSLQFSPGFDGKTTISKWIVEGLVGVSTNWTEVFTTNAPDAKIITVTGLQPYTDYRFRLVAENVKGRSAASDPCEKFQTSQAPPEYAPIDVDAQPVSSSVIKITWTPLQLHSWNGVAKGYAIYFKLNSSDLNNVSAPVKSVESKIFLENLMSSEYELSKLDAYSKYEIKLFAVGEVGQSSPSPTVLAKTYEGAPSSPVQNVNVKPEGSTALKLFWSRLSAKDANGIVLGYKINFKAEGSYPHEGKITVVGNNQDSTDLVGLFPFTMYKISIRAFTVVGDGPFAETKAQTNEDIPGPPSEIIFIFVSPSELRITWKPPYRPNGIVTHYSVAYWPNSTDQAQNSVKTTLNPDLHAFVATGVAANTWYAFAVSAETSVGWGSEARVLAFTTNQKIPPSVPTRPIQSAKQAPGFSQISILIEAASGQTEMVRYFDVEYQEVNGDQWRPWIEKVPGSMKSCVIAGLNPNTAYRFRVRATNDFGVSRFSSESDWMKTLEAEPSAPPAKIVTLTRNSTVVKISWDAPPTNTWNSDFIGYRILYKIYDNPNDTFRVHELPLAGSGRKSFETEIKGLQPFHHYLMQMQSFNQQGSSPSSNGAFVYVGHSSPTFSVTNFRAETLSSTQIRLTWDAWASDEEPINGFKITYQPVTSSYKDSTTTATESANFLLKQDIAAPTMTHFVLSDLQKYTNYSIEMAAFNRAGKGPGQTMTVQTSQDRPGPVGDLVFTDIQLDSVNVSWTPPVEKNGVILGYIVIYKTYKLKEEYIKQIQDKTIRNFLPVYNLEENVTSMFTVQAETVVGYGPPVVGSVKVGPQPGSPSPPKRPSVYPSENSINLEWEKGSSDGKSPVTSYIIQNCIVESKKSRLIRRETLISPSSVLTPQWSTLTLIENPGTFYTVAYSQLEPSAVHKFRIVARNQYGVSYPSPESDPVTVPDSAEDKPFYLQWWFLVILALVSLVIIVIIVAILYITGRDKKYDYNKRNSSTNSLHLVDGGVVTYELRASQKNRGKTATSGRSNRKNHYTRHPPPRPAYPSKVLAYGDDAPTSIPGMQTSTLQSNKMPSFYETLNGHTLDPVVGKPAVENDTSTTGDNESDFEGEKDVSSIVQHYQTTDAVYRDTWRRAAKTVSMHRPDSFSSQSENASLNGAVSNTPVISGHHQHHQQQQPVSRTPMPGFSSFV